MPNNDLISRAAAIAEVEKWAEQGYDVIHWTGIKVMLECQPAVYAVPVRRGHWIDRDGQYECSKCHNISCCKGKYCTDCGAKMDGWRRR